MDEAADRMVVWRLPADAGSHVGRNGMRAAKGGIRLGIEKMAKIGTCRRDKLSIWMGKSDASIVSGMGRGGSSVGSVRVEIPIQLCLEIVGRVF